MEYKSSVKPTVDANYFRSLFSLLTASVGLTCGDSAPECWPCCLGMFGGFYWLPDDPRPLRE